MLRSNGSREIFEHAAAWCRSDDSLKRARGAAILCQLRQAPTTNESVDKSNWLSNQIWMYRDESYLCIDQMLENEQDPVVLASAISALGHLYNTQAIPRILEFQSHPNREVRFAVTFALGCLPNEPQSVSGLLRLASDTDVKIRDWAVFGLGVQGDVDSPEIREVLLRCLDDADQNVREESTSGLGKRRDKRLIPKLLTMLDDPELTMRVAEAAAALLGLDRDNPEWEVADYKAALTRLQISD